MDGAGLRNNDTHGSIFGDAGKELCPRAGTCGKVSREVEATLTAIAGVTAEIAGDLKELTVDVDELDEPLDARELVEELAVPRAASSRFRLLMKIEDVTKRCDKTM